MGSDVKGVDSGKIMRMISKKSHSWWLDSHISPKNSKWLADNLEEMNRSVKEMLKLIEEDGDSFAEKAEMYYQKRPDLVSHVEDFYRMYRALAERYDHLTGELRKNIQSELSFQHSGGDSDFGSELPSPLLPSLDTQADIPIAGSDSDSDDIKSLNGDDGMLHQRIIELENELCIVKEKLHEHECGNLSNLDSIISEVKNNLLVANEKLQVSEAEIMSLQQELNEKNLTSEALSAELSNGNMVISKLDARIVELEAEIEDSKHEIEYLKGVISASIQSIEHLKTQLSDASNKFAEEKIVLQIDVANLEGVINGLKADTEKILFEKIMLETSISERQRHVEELKTAAALAADRFSVEKSSLEAEISTLLQSNELLENKLIQLEDDKTEICQKKDEQIAGLSVTLDNLKEKFTMLSLQRDKLNARVSALNDVIRCREEYEQRMDEDLQKRQVENMKLMKENEEARQEMKELEEEVERQRAALSDGAEAKREVIRQLCMSLEHYRDGYHHLLQVLQGHSKRLRQPTAMAV